MADLEIKGLTKSYAGKKVLDRITVRLPPKGVCLFAGPNRAGKTTLFRTISGLIRPDSGQMLLGGADLSKDKKLLRKRLGVLVQGSELRQSMTPRQILGFFHRLRTEDPEQTNSAVDKAISDYSIKQPDSAVRTLSNGEKKKVQAALASIHSPDIIILDEPLSGLDQKVKSTMIEIIRNLGKQKPVLFSSHLLEDSEECSDHVCLMDRGRIVAFGQLDRILKRDNLIKIKMKIIDRKTIDKIKDIKAVRKIVRSSDWLKIFHTEKKEPEKIIDAVLKTSRMITGISTGCSLKEAFEENIR
jgi:ABC-2 type transport system ATP-binding protein